MSWPLLVIRFLLASTARMEDSEREYELSCRMFGRQPDGQPVLAECSRWAEQGCGCPPDKPPATYIPTWAEATAVQVGWDSTPGESTSITFSFEKEWVGAPPHLYKLYGPAGQVCEAIWAGLDDKEKQAFMNNFGRLGERHPGRAYPAMMKYFDDSEPCGMEINDHQFLPLKRNDDANLPSISDFIEWDSGPSEIKAASFYYNVEEMKRVVTQMLPYVDVPGDFPADRRVQIHVVAPLKAPTPIDMDSADLACHDKQSEINDEKKEYIVGIRSSSTYGNPGKGGPRLTRVGFEIRKSESFVGAFRTARRIADAISTMTLKGVATVGMGDGKKVDILKVRSFAQTSRMKLRDVDFCEGYTQYPNLESEWGPTVVKVANSIAGKPFQGAKLWNTLTLLLCSEWTELVDVEPGALDKLRGCRIQVLTALDELRGSQEPSEEDMDEFRSMAASYAFQLSEFF